MSNALSAARQFIGGMIPDALKPAADKPGATDDGEQPQEIIDGEKHYKAALEEQKCFHPTWYRSIAMYAGQQWLDWSSQTNWFQDTAAPSWRVRITQNLILPKVRAAIAQELQSNPNFYGMPANTTPEAKAAARVASRIFQAKYFDEDFVNKFERMRLWARLTGSSYLTALWDKTADKTWQDVQLDPATGQPVMGEDGQPVMQDYATGDVTFTIDNSFEILMQAGAPEDFDLHERIMRVKIMSVDAIESNWGVKVEPEKVSLDISYQLRVMSLVDAGGRTRSSSAEGSILKNSALVKHYFEKPTVKFPKGREFIYANNKLLQATGDLNYWHNGKRVFPVGKTDDIKMPGRCQGSSGVEQIAPLQIQINKMSSQCIENCNLMNRPKVFAPKGCLDDDVFTDQPAEVVEYTPGPNGQKPEPYTPGEMPQYFFQKYTELKQLMEDIYGMHDISMGRLPRRATSGVAIDALQSADDAPLSFGMRSCGSALSKVMSVALKMMQDNYTEKRMVRMLGKNHEADVIEFKGEDLKHCDAVRIVFAPYQTRQQKIDLAFKLAEAKIIPPEKALEIMELGDFDAVYDQGSFQKNYAEIENMNMAKGIMAHVGPLEPHDIHIKSHLDYINSTGAQLPPEIAMIFKAHIDETKMAQIAAMQPMPNQLPAPDAGPAAPPAPGGPQG